MLTTLLVLLPSIVSGSAQPIIDKAFEKDYNDLIKKKAGLKSQISRLAALLRPMPEQEPDIYERAATMVFPDPLPMAQGITLMEHGMIMQEIAKDWDRVIFAMNNLDLTAPENRAVVDSEFFGAIRETQEGTLLLAPDSPPAQMAAYLSAQIPLDGVNESQRTFTLPPLFNSWLQTAPLWTAAREGVLAIVEGREETAFLLAGKLVADLDGEIAKLHTMLGENMMITGRLERIDAVTPIMAALSEIWTKVGKGHVQIVLNNMAQSESS